MTVQAPKSRLKKGKKTPGALLNDRAGVSIPDVVILLFSAQEAYVLKHYTIRTISSKGMGVHKKKFLSCPKPSDYIEYIDEGKYEVMTVNHDIFRRLHTGRKLK